MTGQTIGTFFRTELADPLGADFHIGLPAEHDHRVAPVLPPPPVTDGPPREPGNPHVPPATANTSA